MTVEALRVGLIADDDLAVHQLKTVLAGAGHQVVVSLSAQRCTVEQLTPDGVDVWVVELGDEQYDDLIVQLYDQTDVPILMGDGIPLPTDEEASARWQRRLREKLKGLLDSGLVTPGEKHGNPIIRHAQEFAHRSHSVEHVWVLGASLGGPEAVKQFLDQLPLNLPVAFVYAQHTQDEQDEVLAKVLARHNQLRFNLCRESAPLRHGQVLIVPTDRQVRFMPLGTVEPQPESWPRPFAPNISQVVADVGRTYRRRSGAIIFSGMSDDGADGVAVMREHGGEVWVQVPESCACSAMPDAALATGCVSQQGTPEEMATMLMHKFAQEYVLTENQTRPA